jgi:hypothetical protein
MRSITTEKHSFFLKIEDLVDDTKVIFSGTLTTSTTSKLISLQNKKIYKCLVTNLQSDFEQFLSNSCQYDEEMKGFTILFGANSRYLQADTLYRLEITNDDLFKNQIIFDSSKILY